MVTGERQETAANNIIEDNYLTFNIPHSRSVLGIFSPMLADICAGTPCCQKTSIMFPDTTSEVLSHLLNVLYTGQ